MGWHELLRRFTYMNENDSQQASDDLWHKHLGQFRQGRVRGHG